MDPNAVIDSLLRIAHATLDARAMHELSARAAQMAQNNTMHTHDLNTRHDEREPPRGRGHGHPGRGRPPRGRGGGMWAFHDNARGRGGHNNEIHDQKNDPRHHNHITHRHPAGSNIQDYNDHEWELHHGQRGRGRNEWHPDRDRARHESAIIEKSNTLEQENSNFRQENNSSKNTTSGNQSLHNHNHSADSNLTGQSKTSQKARNQRAPKQHNRPSRHQRNGKDFNI